MTPTRSYRIWFTQRSGSTLLCESLIATGIAGKPGEHFNLMEDETLTGHYEASNYQDLRDKIWKAGSTPNGVFGVKYSYYHARHMRHGRELLALRDLPENAVNHQRVWSDLFPKVKHIFLTRRNKVRQAVSWWKAIQDEVWHLKAGEHQAYAPEFFQEKYDLDALKHLLKETMLKECAAQAYFDTHQIAPLTVVYEDFIRDPEAVIGRVLNFLDIPFSTLELPPFTLKKTSNAGSEIWVQRLRDDLQQGLEAGPIWQDGPSDS